MATPALQRAAVEITPPPSAEADWALALKVEELEWSKQMLAQKQKELVQSQQELEKSQALVDKKQHLLEKCKSLLREEHKINSFITK